MRPNLRILLIQIEPTKWASRKQPKQKMHLSRSVNLREGFFIHFRVLQFNFISWETFRAGVYNSYDTPSLLVWNLERLKDLWLRGATGEEGFAITTIFCHLALVRASWSWSEFRKTKIMVISKLWPYQFLTIDHCQSSRVSAALVKFFIIDHGENFRVLWSCSVPYLFPPG